MYAYLAAITFFSILLTPYFLFKYLKNPYEWKQRLGFIQIPHHNKKTIWFHAASVGEIHAIIPLVREIINKHDDDWYVVISTTTTTGHERTKEFALSYQENVTPILLPLDIPFSILQALKRISPDLLVIAETEIWPALIHYAHNRKSTIILINGRIAPKTVKNFKKFSLIFRRVLNHIDEIDTQTDEDKSRFEEVTASPVHVTGNLKYALQLTEFDVDEIKKEWHLSSPFIITFGSSRPGEELVVAELCTFLNKKNVDFQIILAPRHLQRLDEVEKILKENNIEYGKLSDLSSQKRLILVDTMGELTKAYAVSDLALVGGSFYDFTGHNPLEPAYFAKPIIMGPYHSSCMKSVEMLKNADAIVISDKNELPNVIFDLFNDPQKRVEMGQKAKEVMEKNRDALEKTLNMIEKFL